jgi:endopeptidase La
MMKRILNYGTNILKTKSASLNFNTSRFFLQYGNNLKYFSNKNKGPNDIDHPDSNDGKENKDVKESQSETKILKISIDEEQTIEEFTQNLTSNNNNTNKDSTNFSKEKEESKEKEKVENFPLIHYTFPIVPHARIVINNPSKNDLLFNMLIKYGKLTPIDEDVTIIDDITLFFEKDEFGTHGVKSTPKKEITPHVLGVLCRITYQNKEKLIIEGLDKIFKIKSLRSGKLKFFNPKETQTVETSFSENEEYFESLLNYFEGIISNHDYVRNSLKLDPDYFQDGNKISFANTTEEIKNLVKEMKENKSSESLKENLKVLSKISNYFILKAYTFSNLIHSFTNPANDLFKILYLNDLKHKVEKINEFYANLQNFIHLKYDFYCFPQPQNLQFQTENPFAHQNEEEKKRINKYKEAVDNKISEVDTIEKQKEEFKRKINEIKSISEEVKKTIEKEINKISSVHMDQENGKRIEYLNHIINIPWEKSDEPVWDIEHARNVLDKNLYGLNDTKQRIYEFIAKNQKKNNKKGCVILLTGGPGTGKTRIAKLIGEALQRKTGFISLAGVSDGKSILGFKRTYVSSTPGMFIREMQHVGVKNPVIVVDEIDKVGFRNTHSNVYYALLQLLNPEENHRFMDHYLEVPFDFSNVIFILTSNSEEIFAPLMDRMEVIRVEPYVIYEKFLIMKNYAKPQIMKEYKFEDLDHNIQITDRALYKLIFEHCKREAGVRRAKKLLENVVRKVNTKLELDLNNVKNGVFQVNSQNILKLLNEPNDEDPILTDMIQNPNKRVGSCTGLFVSRTDQSNSWGSASLFSLSVKEIKTVNDLKKNIKDTSEKVPEALNDLKVHKSIGKDVIQKHNEDDKDTIDEINTGEESIKSTKRTLTKSKSNKKSSSKIKPKRSQFRISSSGNLGEDSLQSVDIALNYSTEFLHELCPEKSDFFYTHELHHDCPEILLPKSGPSAGVVIFLCAISLAMNKPIIPNLAMTGEICIDGSVLKIGGVKEKSQGAQQFGIKTLVIPIGNKFDFMELPSNLKDSFERVFFVENCRQVYNIGFNLDTSGIDCYVPDKYLGDMTEFMEEEVVYQNNLADKILNI